MRQYGDADPDIPILRQAKTEYAKPQYSCQLCHCPGTVGESLTKAVRPSELPVTPHSDVTIDRAPFQLPSACFSSTRSSFPWIRFSSPPAAST